MYWSSGGFSGAEDCNNGTPIRKPLCVWKSGILDHYEVPSGGWGIGGGTGMETTHVSRVFGLSSSI